MDVVSCPQPIFWRPCMYVHYEGQVQNGMFHHTPVAELWSTKLSLLLEWADFSGRVFWIFNLLWPPCTNISVYVFVWQRFVSVRHDAAFWENRHPFRQRSCDQSLPPSGYMRHLYNNLVFASYSSFPILSTNCCPNMDTGRHSCALPRVLWAFLPLYLQHGCFVCYKHYQLSYWGPQLFALASGCGHNLLVAWCRTHASEILQNSVEDVDIKKTLHLPRRYLPLLLPLWYFCSPLSSSEVNNLSKKIKKLPLLQKKHVHNVKIFSLVRALLHCHTKKSSTGDTIFLLIAGVLHIRPSRKWPKIQSRYYSEIAWQALYLN